MSGAAGAAAGAAVAAAAAKRAAELRQEEEDMTGYSADDLDGWEFKIVRANTRKFKDPRAVKKICDEEAKAGWEMLEKFDNSRIRFKRKIEHRSRDQYTEIDAYRSETGITQGSIVAMVLGILALLGGLAYLIVSNARY